MLAESGSLSVERRTRRALSLRLGEHHSFISRVERLQRSVTVAELEAIAKAVGVPPITLFRRAMR